MTTRPVFCVYTHIIGTRHRWKKINLTQTSYTTTMFVFSIHHTTSARSRLHPVTHPNFIHIWYIWRRIWQNASFQSNYGSRNWIEMIAAIDIAAIDMTDATTKYISSYVISSAQSNWACSMMTSSNGNIFRVTGPLFDGHRWIPLIKASDAERWCFLWSAHE